MSFLSRKTGADEINYHFNILKKVAAKWSPQKLPKLNFLHRTLLKHANGKMSDSQALEKIRKVIVSEGLDMNIYNDAKRKLAMQKGGFKLPLNVFNPFKGENSNYIGKVYRRIGPQNIAPLRPRPLKQFRFGGSRKKRTVKPLNIQSPKPFNIPSPFKPIGLVKQRKTRKRRS